MGNKHRRGGNNAKAAEFLFRGVPEDMEFTIRNQAIRTSDASRGALSTELTVAVDGHEITGGVELSKPDLSRPIGLSIDAETGNARLDMPGISVFGSASTCAGIARHIIGESDPRV